MSAYIHIHPDVAAALAARRPVVALETTLIAHGLPRPDNLAVAAELERIVRDEGAIPATIGIVGGVATIGLTVEEIERIATRPDVPKVSVRDLPMVLAREGDGATTVASTSFLAARAGIALFATGGLGGVHREARESWDESADLMTLSRTPITVVSAGVKSILDVGATLERLESLNVAVLGFRTRRFPNFYLTDSGYTLDWAVDTEQEVAAVMAARRAVDPELGGLVVANPIPEEEQLDPALHDRVLDESLAEARRRGLRGKAVSPFLLDYFQRATQGESLRVNKRIVYNNARLAARIASAWSACGEASLKSTAS